MQYFPTVDAATTAVQNVLAAQTAGNDLVLSGLNSSGQNITISDTSTGSKPPS